MCFATGMVPPTMASSTFNNPKKIVLLVGLYSVIISLFLQYHSIALSHVNVEDASALPPPLPTSSSSVVTSSNVTATTSIVIKSKDKKTQANYTAYFCGYSDLANICKLLFPDAFQIKEFTRDEQRQHNTTNDVVISSYGGPCFAHERGGRATRLHKEFQGKVLYINGESHPSYPTELRKGLYGIGHDPDDETHIRVYFGALFLAEFPIQIQETLFYPDKKVKNTRDNFLLYAQGHCVSHRDKAFRELSKINTVYAGGKCPSGAGRIANDAMQRVKLTERTYEWKENSKHFSTYRFGLTMENALHDGYITEKIFNAFLGGTIPIYYGPKDEIVDIFNPNAFIYYDVNNPQAALKRIQYLESNQTAYEEVLHAPILGHGNETVKKYFSYHDDVGGGELKRRIRSMMGMEEDE
eukprot:scaffold1000_cov166-Amphora_coffeaeformis.AAC.24